MSLQRLDDAERRLLEQLVSHTAATLGNELMRAVTTADTVALDALHQRARRLAQLADGVHLGAVAPDSALLLQLRGWRAGLLELVGGEREQLADHLAELAACDALLERAAAGAHLQVVDA